MKNVTNKIMPLNFEEINNHQEIFSYDKEWNQNEVSDSKASKTKDSTNSTSDPEIPGEFGPNPQKEDEPVRGEEALECDYAMTNTGQIVVTPGTVKRVIAEWTGLPLTNLGKDEKARFRGLEKVLSGSIIGQPRAITVVAKSLLRYAAGMRNPDRPIGSFLLIGPTGVGKTELTKKMAEYLFGSQKSLIRLDMSEYMEKHTVSRLIGSPPGYVGYEEGGQLTDAVLTNPYSIVLFDEMEKAHPDVFNLLLQILDDGILSDSNGRVVSFANTIIFLTSNMGAETILKFCESNPLRNEDTEEKLKKELMPVLETRFRPEFLNRLDEIVVFYPLNRNEINDIAYLMLQEVDDRLAAKKHSFLITSRLLSVIRREGFDPAYGARPLRRTITKWVEDPISEALLLDHPKLKAGGCTFLLDVDNAKLPKKGIAIILTKANREFFLGLNDTSKSKNSSTETSSKEISSQDDKNS